MTPPPTATAVKGGARPQVSPRRHDVHGIERVYVWDLLVRTTHWLIMVSVFILAITGIYIGKPYLIPAQPGGEHFVMATVKVVHFYTAIIFALAVVSRIALDVRGLVLRALASVRARGQATTRRRLQDVEVLFVRSAKNHRSTSVTTPWRA